MFLSNMCQFNSHLRRDLTVELSRVSVAGVRWVLVHYFIIN